MTSTTPLSPPTAEQTDAPAAPAGPAESDLFAVLRLAIPSTVATASGTAMSFVDFAFISQLGSQAQAALGNAAVLVWTLFGLGVGVASAVSTFAAQALGRGQVREGAAYMWQAIWMAGVFGLACLLLIPAVPWLYAAFGHPEAVRILEVRYTRILLLAAMPIVTSAAISHYFNGIHKPVVTMLSVLGANLFNVAADYALIFGHWGLPAMGISGAALATLLATTLRAVWLLAALGLPAFQKQFEPFKPWRCRLKRMGDLLRLGGPIGLQWIAEIGAWALFANWLVGRFGTTHLAATHIAWKFMELSWMPAIGIGIAINAAVGKAIGQGRPDLANRRTRIGLACCMGYMGLMGLLFLVLRRPLVGLLTADPAVLALGIKLMLFAAAFQIFDAMYITYGSALRGAGDTKVPAIFLVVYCYTLMILAGWLIGRLWPQIGSLGPWLMCTVYAILLGLTLRYRWKQGRWRDIRIFSGTETTRSRRPDEAAAGDYPNGRND